MLRRRVSFSLLLPLLFTGLLGAAEAQDLAELSIKPIYVTTRIFQLRAQKGRYEAPTDQLFRYATAKLADEERWQTSFQKLYPGFEAALLQTVERRIFRVAKPATVKVGQDGTKELVILLSGANSPGDGLRPGTSVVPEIELRFFSPGSKPLSYTIQPLEVETGMTYFFLLPTFKLTARDYTQFVRPGAPEQPFANDDFYLLFAFSVELDKRAPAPRPLEEQQLQAAAQKKVQPELPAALRQSGLGGKVQVRVEIAPDGKVAKALTLNSSLPEMNRAVIAAVRQWEFALTLFKESKEPIGSTLTFELK
jgi:TonB family protein